MKKYLEAIEDASIGTVKAVMRAAEKFPEIEFDYWHWTEEVRHLLDGIIKVACYDREIEESDFDKLLTARLEAYKKARKMLDDFFLENFNLE